MSLRNPLSGLKKKMKWWLAGGRDELEKRGADKGEESLTSLLPKQGPHVVMKGRCGHPWPGNKVDVGGEQVDSMDLTLHSDGSGCVPTSERGEGGVIKGRETSRRDFPSTPSISNSGESGGMQIAPYFNCCL